MAVSENVEELRAVPPDGLEVKGLPLPARKRRRLASEFRSLEHVSEFLGWSAAATHLLGKSLQMLIPLRKPPKNRNRPRDTVVTTDTDHSIDTTVRQTSY